MLTQRQPDSGNYKRKISKSLQTKIRLIAAMRKTLGVISQACEIAGVERATYYKYYKADKQFAAACNECQEIALDFVESKLFKQIENGNAVSTIFYLKTRGKQRGYVERQELTGADGQAIQSEVQVSGSIIVIPHNNRD